MTALKSSLNRVVLKCIVFTFAVHFLFIFTYALIDFLTDLFQGTTSYILFHGFEVLFHAYALHVAAVVLGIVMRKKSKDILSACPERSLVYSRRILLLFVVAVVCYATEFSQKVEAVLHYHSGIYSYTLYSNYFFRLAWYSFVGGYMLTHMLLCLAIVFVSKKNIEDFI